MHRYYYCRLSCSRVNLFQPGGPLILSLLDILNLDLLPFIIHFVNHSYLKIFTFIIIIVIYMYLFFYNHWLVWLISRFMSQIVEVWRVRHSSHLYHDRRKRFFAYTRIYVVTFHERRRRFFAFMIDFDSWNDNFETTGRKSVNRSRLIFILLSSSMI